MKIVIDISENQYKTLNAKTQDDIVDVIDHGALINAIKNGTPLPKRTGKWLDKKTTIKKAHGIAYGRWGCSVCKVKQPHKSNFCPNCGADMQRGEQE